MIDVQIFIEDQRIDVFERETLGLTSKIQDAKDIEKIFTDFTYPFTIPASDVNNKVFKHFYEYSIKSGFDARKKKEAKIYLNNILFRRGKVFLSGVEMKDKKPYAYIISFFGNLVSMKDLAGDLTLRNLDLSAFDHDYSFDNVRTIAQNGLSVNSDSEALIYPLITSERRLFYDSNVGDESSLNYSGNVYKNSQSLHNLNRGVSYTDLKPAIKVKHIISAIEDRIGISFVKDDFINTDIMDNLYLWMSNKRGKITEQNDDSEYLYVDRLSGYSKTPSSDQIAGFSISGETITVSADQMTFANRGKFFINVNALSGQEDIPYAIKLIDITRDRTYAVDGVGDDEYVIDILSYAPDESKQTQFRIEFYSEEEMTNGTITLSWRSGPLQPLIFEQESYTVALNTEADLVATNQIPDMKIIDFLSSYMKMFNLTAFFIDDEADPNFGKIKLMTLDDYYADAVNNVSGGTIDITEFIDTREHLVSTNLPFSEVNFTFKENDSILMEKHKEFTDKDFGNSKYNIRSKFDLEVGEEYDIEIKFTKLKYERLRDNHTKSPTEIQWGYAAGGDFEVEENEESDGTYAPPDGNYSPVQVKPLLFFGIKRTGVDILYGHPTNWANLTSYFMPSNSNELGTLTTAPSHTINFDSEIDEYAGVDYGLATNSLFETYYKKYITSVLSPNKRIFKFKAYFPLGTIINYKLNDQLKIQDRIYRINSISTNILDGETNLELINLNADEIV